jgi:glycosyltransferase involved in cell wall biosynthesis
MAEELKSCTPGLTVIIPTLNAMPYLPEALASLEAQTFRDFEVLLWDNGSSDGTVEEAKRWIPARLPGLVIADRPLPLHDCLAAMVVEAHSEFIARMDGDDICLPDRFERQLVAMLSDPGLAVLGGQIDLIDADGEKTGEICDYPTDFCGALTKLIVVPPLPHPGVMMRRSIILAAGNYCVSKPVEDFDLWFRVAKFGKITNLAEKVLRYRINSTSVVNHAKHTGELASSIRDCVRINLHNTFGLSCSSARLLAEAKHPASLLPMIKVAQSISKLSGVGLRAVLSRPDFLFSARCYTANWDIFSKSIYRVMQKI